VKYRGIYPGIDAVFYGNQRQLEYDFVVAPGADPEQISLGLTGVTPSLDIEGNVLLKLADGDLALRKPVVYQIIDGGKTTVDAGYTISGGKVRFQLGKYDRAQTLVIDPVFTYLTYLGGSGPDQIGGSQVVDQTASPAQALAIDSAGDVYVTGFTMSTDFPVANAYQATSKTNTWTAFVSALNPSGTAFLYSTYLGGSVYTSGNSVVWDSHDNALYVVGTTNSPDFPITAGAFQTLLAPTEVNNKAVSSGQDNAFVAKFSASGQLTNSTFLGGDYQTAGFGIATDSQGRAYVVGYTVYNCIPPDSATYECFPTTPGAVIPAGTVSTEWQRLCIRFRLELVDTFVLHAPRRSQWRGVEHFGGLWCDGGPQRKLLCGWGYGLAKPAYNSGRVPADTWDEQCHTTCRLCRQVRTGKRKRSQSHLPYLFGSDRTQLWRPPGRRGCRQPGQRLYRRLHKLNNVPLNAGRLSGHLYRKQLCIRDQAESRGNRSGLVHVC
jgi:hypothetical protein